jgi:hypothetical protein
MILTLRLCRVLSVTPGTGRQVEEPGTFGYGAGYFRLRNRVLSVTPTGTFGYGAGYFRLRNRVLSVTDSEKISALTH